jgi:steroid delta-isomerase-like uncharacterized protein
MTHLEKIDQALRALNDPAQRDRYFELYSPHVDFYGYDGVEPNFAGMKQFYAQFWAAFPDTAVEVLDTVESGDKIAVRYLLRGTQHGVSNGIPATGKAIAVEGITILRFADGLCVERWTAANMVTMLTQLGVMPGA